MNWIVRLCQRLDSPIKFLAAILTAISIVTASILFFMETAARERDIILNSWSAVADHEGKRASGGRDVAISQLRAANQSLAGVSLRNAILSGLRLDGEDLALASFENARLSNVDFSSSSLHEVNMEGTHFSKPCNFNDTRIERTRLGRSIFTDCLFRRSLLHDISTNETVSLDGSDLSNATISNSTLKTSVFDNSRLDRARLIEVEIIDSSFQRVSVAGSVWQGVVAPNSHLLLYGERVLFKRGSYVNSRFDRSLLTDSTFEGVDLQRASFFSSDLSHTTFKDCDLRGANFRSANLKGTKFINCRIKGADFLSATNFDLRKAFHNCDGRPIN